jgi:hypothetical protein
MIGKSSQSLVCRQLTSGDMTPKARHLRRSRTLRTRVKLTLTFTDRQAGHPPYYTVDAGQWTFQLVNNDDWRICHVTTPEICGDVLTCITLNVKTGTMYLDRWMSYEVVGVVQSPAYA